MYEIKVVLDFSAAHMLRNYKGKCENLHGHNWKVEAIVSSEKLDKLGMVADFKELKEQLHEVLEELDHKNLNDLPYFKEINPTSENIAKYIYEQVIHRGRGRLNVPYKVIVWESDTACATYEL